MPHCLGRMTVEIVGREEELLSVGARTVPNDVELAEDVSQVRLHGLGAEEEGRGDLGIRPAIDDEPRDLLLALRQRFDTDRIRLAGLRSPMHVAAEPAQLVSAASRYRRAPQAWNAVAARSSSTTARSGSPGLRECPAGERARERSFYRHGRIVGGRC